MSSSLVVIISLFVEEKKSKMLNIYIRNITKINLLIFQSNNACCKITFKKPNYIFNGIIVNY